MACQLDFHPLAAEIDTMLRDGAEYRVIMEFVSLNGGPEVNKPQLSRHAIGDLKLDPRGPRKKQKTEVQDMEPADLDSIVGEGLKIALWRMKNAPEDVTTPALLGFLTQAMKLLESKKDNSTDLSRKLGQLSDASKTPEG